MNEQERFQGYEAALEELKQRFGFVIQATLQTEQLGAAVLTKPVLQLVPIPDWQPLSVPPPATPLSIAETGNVAAARLNGRKKS